jgi:hypothetical protein
MTSGAISGSVQPAGEGSQLQLQMELELELINGKQFAKPTINSLSLLAHST